jgi:hypothetical protein
MLLADFVGRAHKHTEDDRQVPVDLHQVKCFEFGESYIIRMKNGKSFDVRDLDVVLDILYDEFHLWRNQVVPEMEIESVLAGKASKERVLRIAAVQSNNFVPAPPVQKFIDRLRKYITMYNLSGTWDQFTKDNL